MRKPYWSSASATYLDREAAVAGLREVARRATSASEIGAIWLFGSLARGGGSPGSDADLLVLVPDRPSRRLRDAIPDLLEALAGAPLPLDLHRSPWAASSRRWKTGIPS